MSWLSKIVNKLWSRVKTFWSKIDDEVEEAFTMFLETFGDAAFKAVSAAAITALTGSQKMDLVLGELKEQVKKAGWVAGESALRTLAETAYTAYKASNGDTLVAPPGSSDEVLDNVGM